MANRRSLLIPLLILLFIHFYPESSRPHSQPGPLDPDVDQVIAQERHDLTAVQNAIYDERIAFDAEKLRTLNLTNSQEGENFAWDAFPQVQDRVRQQARYVKGENGTRAIGSIHDALPFYRNVSGVVRGPWVRSRVNVTVPQLNLTRYAQDDVTGDRWMRPFHGNITANEGMAEMEFWERTTGDSTAGMDASEVSGMRIEMTLDDEDGGEPYTVELLGVYFPKEGHGIFTTTSSKFSGVFLLPQLALSNDTFERSRTLAEQHHQRHDSGSGGWRH